METCVKLPLSEDRLSAITDVARDYIFSHGVVMRSKDRPDASDTVIHAPFALFPSPVPRRCFLQAQSVQVDFNLLMHRVAHDFDFLSDCLKSVIKVDDFTRRLWSIFETVHKEGKVQPISLAMNRSDYMFDCSTAIPSACPTSINSCDLRLRQIEFNTIAASFAGLSQHLTPYYRFITGQCSMINNTAMVPSNESVEGLAEAVVKAWQLYSNPCSVVLFLVYPVERNVYDQRWLEYAIIELDSRVKVIRRSLKDIGSQGHLADDKRLIVDGMEVAIVYQRSCYTPADFAADESLWTTRLMMERSKAIVCPSTGYQLAGTKKVQQVLAQPGIIERFIPNCEAAQRIRDTFAGQYSLDMGEVGDESIALAMASPDRFVLKPQREGGGNNTFGDEIRTLLMQLKDSEERASYILMERIQPMPVSNYAIMHGQQVALSTMVSELGIYGTLVGTKDEIYVNTQKGYLLRTKKLGTDEGGVATGYSVLDSPYLVD